MDLLERYGPQRRDQRPDMPFWRLKGDGFWELQNAELCSTKGSRQPPRRELIEYNVAGGFDVDNFALVAKNHRLIDTLAQQLLEAHFPVSIQEDIADEMGFDIRTSLRQRDPKFRQMVLRAYNYQCAICGFNMRHDNAPIALEAAHIRWKLPISDGSRTMALVKYLMAWHCAQSIIKRLIVVRLVWMKICV